MPGLPTTDLTATVVARTLRSAMRTLPTRFLEGPIYRAAMERAKHIGATSTRTVATTEA